MAMPWLIDRKNNIQYSASWRLIVYREKFYVLSDSATLGNLTAPKQARPTSLLCLVQVPYQPFFWKEGAWETHNFGFTVPSIHRCFEALNNKVRKSGISLI